MGFVGEVMDNVKGVHLYYIAGLFIFLALFIVILTRTIRMPKADAIEIKTAIFDSNETVSIDNGNYK